MVFRARKSVSASSCRAISRIASLAILQTIALPTERPRREAHFTWKLATQAFRKESNGLDHHAKHFAQWLRDQARSARNHCFKSTSQTVETIALARPLRRLRAHIRADDAMA